MNGTINRDRLPLPDPSAFPHEMRAVASWAACKKIQRDGGVTKFPIDVRTGRGAKSNDPATWATFAEAYAYAKRYGYGLWFFIAPPFVGVDIDHCRNKCSGELIPLAVSVLGELPTYAEVSTSGEGVKAIAYGTKPGGRCRRKGLSLEIYGELRGFYVTGERLPDAPLAINDCQEGLDFIYSAAFGEEPVAESVAWDSGTVTDDDDQAVIDWLHNYRNGAKFARYWRGEDEGDASGGDQGLANIIAWRVGPDPARIEAIFNASARASRAKWHRRADYRERTIRHAIERCNGRFYESRPQPQPAAAPYPRQEAPPPSKSADPALGEYLAMTHEALAQRAYRAEQQAARAQKTLTSVIRIRSNPHIKAERDTLTACIVDIKAEQANGRADAEGWVRQPAVRIADTAGKGDKTVSKHRHLGQEWGVIELKLVQETDPNTGQRRTVTYARTTQEPEDALEALVTLNPQRSDKEGWGGKRTPCPRCGSTKTRTVTYCGDCDLILKETTHDGEPGEELPTDDVGNVAPIAVETLADPDASYPPAIVAEAEEEGPKLHTASVVDGADEEADDWDPYTCNHRGCTSRIVVGSRYCGQHRGNYEYAPPVSPPVAPEEAYYEPPTEPPPDAPPMAFGTLEETPDGLREVIRL